MRQEYYWQATSFADSATGLFKFSDTPCKTYEECKRMADEAFGPGRYTIQRIPERQALRLFC